MSEGQHPETSRDRAQEGRPAAPDSPSAKAPSRRKTDRWVKLGFVLVVVVAAALIYLLQQSPPELPGWGTDLGAALRRAERNHTKVLVFFSRSRDAPSLDDERMMSECLKRQQVTKPLEKLGYEKVHLTLRKNKSAAKEYEVEKTPALLLLDSSGKAIQRHVGFIREMEVHRRFLSPNEGSEGS